ncbi:MAG: DUF3047 domain-containing protein [Candidatus Latescibacteria bacterium]|nr:DUF3047 domain-containing protein [Candidatus Latescibacterota bacterium]
MKSLNLYFPNHRATAVLFAVLGLWWGSSAVFGSAFEAADLQDYIDRFNAELAPPQGAPGGLPDSLVSQQVDFAALTRRTFGDYVAKTLKDYQDPLSKTHYQQLLDTYQKRLEQAYRKRLLADLAAYWPNLQGLPLRLQSLDIANAKGHADLVAGPAAAPWNLRLHLRQVDGVWRIVDLEKDGRSLSQRYRKRYRTILDKNYSLPVLTARLENRPYIVLDDFSQAPLGQVPLDWGAWRPKDKKKPKRYLVEAGEGFNYLAARDSGSSVILGKFIHWNPRRYPILTWCWRVNALPPGGNELVDGVNDSAAGLYVIFSQKFWRIPMQLKYVWSSTLPEGQIGRRNKIFRPWFFVVESGADNLGKWTFEMVDLEDHHEMKLGGSPKDRTIGLALLTDANNTDSYAEAFYTDLRVWPRAALERGQITNHCTCTEEMGQVSHPFFSSHLEALQDRGKRR